MSGTTRVRTVCCPTEDDGPRAGTTYEAVSQLKPVFRRQPCPLSDGAAAVVIPSDTKAKELGPLARIVATGVSGLSPEIRGLGPIGATRKALANAGMSIDDIDLFEINEALAVQVLGPARELGIDEDTLNVWRSDRIGSSVRADPRQDVRCRNHMHRRRPGHGDGDRAAQLAVAPAEIAPVCSQIANSLVSGYSAI